MLKASADMMRDAIRQHIDQHGQQVGVFYGTEEFRMLQIAFSDAEGRFPEDPDCDAEHKSQIVLPLLN